MSLRSPRTTTRTLAAGAALVACPLAAAGPPSPLNYGTISSASTAAAIGTASGDYSGTTATSFVNTPLGNLQGGGSGSFIAYGFTTPGGKVDMFRTAFTSPTGSGTWAFTMSITVTLTRSAYFADYGALPVGGQPLPWFLNGNPLANNAVISAGTHTFTGQAISPFGAPITTAEFGMALVYPSTGGVPLPGAAGLAAVGLIACRGRRRR
jgi:hypothetical protein